MEWDGQNPARAVGEWLIAVAQEAAALDPPHEFPTPRVMKDGRARSSPRCAGWAIIETLAGHKKEQETQGTLFDLFGDPGHCWPRINADERRLGWDGMGGEDTMGREQMCVDGGVVSGVELAHRELTGRILKVFYEVYNGPRAGFLESVYEKAMHLALGQAGISAQAQREIDVWFRGVCVGQFRADLLVEDRVILELKAVRQLDGAHQAQLLNYLRATEVEVGLLLNFGEKPEFKRLAFSNSRKRRPASNASETPSASSSPPPSDPRSRLPRLPLPIRVARLPRLPLPIRVARLPRLPLPIRVPRDHPRQENHQTNHERLRSFRADPELPLRPADAALAHRRGRAAREAHRAASSDVLLPRQESRSDNPVR